MQNMKLEKLNPAVKAFTVLIAVIILSFQYRIGLNLAVFLTSMLLLLLFSDASAGSIIKMLIPASIVALGLFIMGLYYAKGNSVTSVDLSDVSAVPYAVRAAMSTNLYTASQLATRLLAYAGVGIFFSLSTDGELFIASLMYQCRLSPKFAYGILAAFNLIPNMTKEYRNVKLAFRTRGMHVCSFSSKPLFAMLVNSIHWSENVAMAMESKGFYGKSPRNCYHIPKIHWYDWLFSILTIGLILFGVLFGGLFGGQAPLRFS